MAELMKTIGIWLSAYFTLSIFSFLYKDNPFYKLAEQIFVGLSAAYWLVYTIYNILIPNLFNKLFTDFTHNWILLIPMALGIMMLMRMFPKLEWVSHYPMAIMIGTTAAIAMLLAFQSDFLSQIAATMVNPFKFSSPVDIVGTILLIIGTICGIYFFYFSKKQEGFYKIPSKIGIWFLMVSFGASFGYTVMARISLLIGRLDFLLRDWLHIIR
ncbi:MAG TPA: hypothetical protein PKH17_03720 [Candidatus Syntrophosphaera sp.]|jgi:nitrate reductase gamma subunit|nr:hypothetical protein [Candidatus Syntrophosphaera sp.]HOD59835.1 hypothetical protein [Candidatus Syntrophosphaera sp.]